jgi:hypothetical protein
MMSPNVSTSHDDPEDHQHENPVLQTQTPDSVIASLFDELKPSLNGFLRDKIPEPDQGKFVGEREFNEEVVWRVGLRARAFRFLIAQLAEDIAAEPDGLKRTRLWQPQHVETILNAYYRLHPEDTPVHHRKSVATSLKEITS